LKAFNTSPHRKFRLAFD